MSPRKSKRPSLTFVEVMQRIAAAGLSNAKAPNRQPEPDNALMSIEDRVKVILGLANSPKKNADNMLIFIMYDIESNRVRTQVVRYLERSGCSRIQKSIFLGNLSAEKVDKIKNDLVEVQAAYDNNDSILVVPISTDYLRAMKIIGQTINVDVITHSRNTIFF